MGFLKRFFSLGGKKSKKSKSNRQNHPAERVDPSGRFLSNTPEPWQEREADANRLLRSSSAHFRVVKEVDYSTLPPLPHPINNLAVTPTPTPTATPASTPGLHRRGTYTVTVHERQLHSRTEFPNANPPLAPETPTPRADLHFLDESPISPCVDPTDAPFTPHDKSRLLRLRQDPSVASLLNMYDNKGHIKSTAFSNTPPNTTPVQEIEGREQRKRNGSTLRELLGEPELPRTHHRRNSSTFEGDISWAERFLGEHAHDNSFALGAARVIPNFSEKSEINLDDPAPAADCTRSEESHTHNVQSISSLIVEISETARDPEGSSDVNNDTQHLGIPAEPTTPTRSASEVFGFITERRKSLRERNRAQELGRLSPLPVSHFSSSSDEATSHESLDRLSVVPTTRAYLSVNSSPGGLSDTSVGQIHTATLTKLTPVMNPLASCSTDTLSILRANTPTPSPLEAHMSRAPRGPRPSPGMAVLTPTQSSFDEVNDEARTERYPAFILHCPDSKTKTDSYTRVRPRPQRRSASQTSKAPSVRSNDIPDLCDTPVPPPRAYHYHHNQRQRRSSNTRSRRFETASKENNSPNRSLQKSRRSSTKSSIASNSPKSLTPGKPGIRQPQRRHGSAGSYSHSRTTLLEVRLPKRVNGESPSPASSSELSPVGKDMMANLRNQRSRARDEVKGSGSGRSSVRK